MNSTAYPRHQRLRGLLVAALCTGLLSSCGLLRDVSHPDDETTRTETRQETGVNPRLAAFQSDPAYGPMLKGNLQAEVLIGKETYSSKVNATIVRGQGIYWSVVPFPLIEAARVWFTPQGVTAIDKIHGRYAEVSYAELSSLVGFPISYNDVERLLLGKPFFPAEARGGQGRSLQLRRHRRWGHRCRSQPQHRPSARLPAPIICAGSSMPSTSLRASSSASPPVRALPSSR